MLFFGAGVASSFMQQLHQLPLSPSIRPSPGPSACQPARSQLITTPAVQTMPQLSRPHSVRSSPVAGQSVAAPPVQAIQHTAALFSGTSSRPPVINAITGTPAGNPRVGGEIRSAAPHLQPFRPTVAASVPTATSPTVSQLRPIQMPCQPIQHPPPPGPLPRVSQPPLPNLVTQNRSELQGGMPAPPNPSLSTQGLVMDMDQRPSVPETFTSPLPDICSTFRSLELSDLEMLDNVQGNHTSAVETDVVCLSDDD